MCVCVCAYVCVCVCVSVLHIIIVMFEPMLMCSIHYLYAMTDFHILYCMLTYCTNSHHVLCKVPRVLCKVLKNYNNYLLLALLFSLMMTTSWEVQTKSVSSSRMKPLTKMVCTVSLVPLFFPPVIEEGLVVWVGWLAVCWTGGLCVCVVIVTLSHETNLTSQLIL